MFWLLMNGYYSKVKILEGRFRRFNGTIFGAWFSLWYQERLSVK